MTHCGRLKYLTLANNWAPAYIIVFLVFPNLYEPLPEKGCGSIALFCVKSDLNTALQWSKL